MGLSFVFLFSVPDFASPTTSFIYVLIIYIASATAYTIFAVPYISMPAEMSADPHERTVIMSYRMFFAMLGLVLGAALSPQIVEWFGGGRKGFAAMSFIIGGFCAATMIVAFFATKHLPRTEPAQTSSPIMAQIRQGLNNKPFLSLICAYFVQLIGVATFTAMAPFFFVYVLKTSASMAGMFFLFFFGATTLSMPIWSYACRTLGKRSAYILAAMAYAVASLAFLFVDAATSITTVFAISVLVGLPFGGIMMVPFSMLTDTIQWDGHSSGDRKEGIYTGLWTAGEKTGLAFGPLVAGLLLAAGGFLESNGAPLQQPELALQAIQAGFAGAPTVFVLLSFLVLRKYDLSDAMLRQQSRKQAHFPTPNT